MKRILIISFAAVAVSACQSVGPNGDTTAASSGTTAASGGTTAASGGAKSQPASQPASSPQQPKAAVDLKGGTVAATPVEDGFEVATFAGGCFWCMEPPFDEVEGVKSTTSGYTGGPELHPSYKQVAYGRTGHTESIRVVFDPKVVGYDKLLEVFWRNVNPTDAGGQFVDRGKQYRPAVFVHSDAQKKAAEASKQALQASGKFDSKIIVPIQTAGEFWVAEDYHQDFYKKSPARYYGYRRGSGRDQFIARVWGTSK